EPNRNRSDRPHRQRRRLARCLARGAEAVRRARRQPDQDPIATHARRDVAVPLLHRGPGSPDRSQRRRRARRGAPAVQVLQGPRVVSSDLISSPAMRLGSWLFVAAALTCIACGPDKGSGPKTADAAQNTDDALAVLPGGAIAVGTMDARAFFGSQTFGADL